MIIKGRRTIAILSLVALLVSSAIAFVPVFDAKADILGDHDVDVYKILQLPDGTTTWENAPLVGMANQSMPGQDEEYYMYMITYGFGGIGVCAETGLDGFCIDDVNPDREVREGIKTIDEGYDRLVKYCFQPSAFSSPGRPAPDAGAEGCIKMTFSVPEGCDVSSAKIKYYDGYTNGAVTRYNADNTISACFRTIGDPNNPNGFCQPIDFYVEYKEGTAQLETLTTTIGDGNCTMTTVKGTLDNGCVFSSNKVTEGELYNRWLNDIISWGNYRSKYFPEGHPEKIDFEKNWIYSYALTQGGTQITKMKGKGLIGVPKPLGLSTEDKKNLRVYIGIGGYSYPVDSFFEEDGMIYFPSNEYVGSTLMLAVTSGVERGQGTWSNMDDESDEPMPGPGHDNVISIDEQLGKAVVNNEFTGGSDIVDLNIIQQSKIYRMYNPATAEHLYTKDVGEVEWLEGLGWNHEVDADYTVVDANDKESVPVYRLYNPNTDTHHYTESAEEVKYDVSIGWKYERISHYVYDKNSTKGTPQWRLYEQSGPHNWTSNVGEINWLMSSGWVNEGIRWRVL